MLVTFLNCYFWNKEPENSDLARCSFKCKLRAPGWLRRLVVRPRLRSWSCCACEPASILFPSFSAPPQLVLSPSLPLSKQTFEKTILTSQYTCTQSSHAHTHTATFSSSFYSGRIHNAYHILQPLATRLLRSLGWDFYLGPKSRVRG